MSTFSENSFKKEVAFILSAVFTLAIYVFFGGYENESILNTHNEIAWAFLFAIVMMGVFFLEGPKRLSASRIFSRQKL